MFDPEENEANGLPLDFITELPTKEEVDKLLEATSKEVKAKVQPKIEQARAACKAAGAKYRKTKEQQDWQDFCELRGITAGLSSGLRKQIKQQQKIALIGDILKRNNAGTSAVNYTLIQFIAKQIDGHELDKETCLLLRIGYKGNKVRYIIPDRLKPFWAVLPLLWGLKPKAETPPKKVMKV